MGRPPIGKVAMTGAERTRLYRLKLGPVTKPVTKPAGPSHDALARDLAAAQQRVRELEAALAAKPASKPGKAEPASEEMRALEGKLLKAMFEIDDLRAQLAKAKAAEPEQVRALRQRVHDLEQERARRDSAAKAAQTKAEKPALPPDEARERRIKALETQVKNLKIKLHFNDTHFAEAIAMSGGLPRPTQIAIDKVLHPDTRGHATEADKDHAGKLWNAWKDTRTRAKRR